MNFWELNWLDYIAIGIFFTSILMFNIRIETETSERPSTHSLMLKYRRQWMEVLTTRDNRIVDATILNMLQQSSRFFASGMMIAVGGVIALMSRPDLQTGLEGIFHKSLDPTTWNFKLFFVGLVLANGFLKFIWSGRVFGYCAIVMAAIPENSPSTKQIVRAAELNITAARSFNRGLRMIYFALAAMCWLLGAIPFIAATGFVSYTIWRREFSSATRIALMGDDHG